MYEYSIFPVRMMFENLTNINERKKENIYTTTVNFPISGHHLGIKVSVPRLEVCAF